MPSRVGGAGTWHLGEWLGTQQPSLSDPRYMDNNLSRGLCQASLE
jgi:hypothetical protein